MTLTRAQHRELIAEAQSRIKAYDLGQWGGSPDDPLFNVQEVYGLCDGYTQALTDLDAAEQRERALRDVIRAEHQGRRARVYLYGPCRCIYCEAGALPTPSAPPQGQE